MPITLNWPERQIFLNHNWGPGPILDMFAPLAFQAINAAHKLNIFETLRAQGAVSAADLSRTLKADEFGVRLLMDTLCSLGYACRKGKSRYANSAMTRTWMLKQPTANLCDMIGYFEDAFDRWSNLDKTILNGKPLERADKWLSRHPGTWDRYHANMRSAADLLAGQVATRSKIAAGAKRLIDIGGSHGLYAVRFCQRFPGLSAVVFDQKEARPIAQQTIADNGMAGRMSFVEGDLLSDDLGTGYDVALLINLVRIFTEEDTMKILKKTHGAMHKGGTILVADQFCSSMPTPLAQANALLIMLELYNSGVGKIHTAADVVRMLAKTGFAKPHEIRLPRSPGISMIAATR
jgi:hypothetical protein